jgi:hypothetical protein
MLPIARESRTYHTLRRVKECTPKSIARDHLYRWSEVSRTSICNRGRTFDAREEDDRENPHTKNAEIPKFYGTKNVREQSETVGHAPQSEPFCATSHPFVLRKTRNEEQK